MSSSLYHKCFFSRKNLYIYIHIHTCIYIYIYIENNIAIYTRIYLYIKNNIAVYTRIYLYIKNNIAIYTRNLRMESLRRIDSTRTHKVFGLQPTLDGINYKWQEARFVLWLTIENSDRVSSRHFQSPLTVPVLSRYLNRRHLYSKTNREIRKMP